MKTLTYQSRYFSIIFLGCALVGANIIPHVEVPRKRCRWAWHGLSDSKRYVHILSLLLRSLVAYLNKEIWAEECENPAFQLYHASFSLAVEVRTDTRLSQASYLVVIDLAWKGLTQLPHKYHKVSSFEDILGSEKNKAVSCITHLRWFVFQHMILTKTGAIGPACPVV